MRPEFRTWRVRYIPLDFNEQQLSDALQNHPKLWNPIKHVLDAGDLGLDKCDGNVVVKTLSTDIQSTHLVATVRFRRPPPRLLESGDPLSIEISAISANLPAGSKRKQESCQIIIDDHFFDLTVLSSPGDVNYKVDILAISGLGSHAYGSYMHKMDGHMWLSDSLSKDCPSARVVMYGYDSKLQGSESFEDLDGLASSFQIALSRLTTSSRGRKPLVIIGHSLGGLVIKQSLIRIAESDCESLLDSVVGAMFFGVPNDGMDIECLIPMVKDQPNRSLLESINRINSQILRMQKLNFFKVLKNSNIDLFCFYETLRSPTAAKDASGKYIMAGEQRCLVSQSSASSCLPQGASSDHTIPLNCAHSDLVKFSLGDAEYAKVLHTLRELCRRVLQRVSRTQECMSTLPDRRAQQAPEKLARLNLATTSELRQSHLDSLKFPQIDGRLLNIKVAHAKTCQWLLSKSEYQDWLNVNKSSEHHGFLWIKGKPGTGKSTIMKFAYTNAMNTMKDTIVISFFFNARGEDLEKSVLGMYRSLLVQLLVKVPNLLYLFDSLGMVSPNNDDDGQWDIEIVQNLFGCAVENLGRPLTCFIDALDECEEDQVRDMVQFFESIGELAVSSQIRFNICLSSRHYPHITVEKSVQLTLEGQEGHEQDMANYLHSKLKAGRSKQVEQIKDEILERASGIFLWIILVVKMLNKEFDRGRIHALRKRLDEIPNGLDELFSDILTRDSQNMEEMILCLQWILYAKRPLKREELYFAILAGVDPDAVTAWDPEDITTQDIERFVLNSSKGLADVTKSKDQTVQFIHESVRDFLLKGNGLNMLRSNLTINFPSQSHDRLRQCCGTYMRIDTFENLPLRISLPTVSSQKAAYLDRISSSQNFPFLEYAVHNVLYHADAAHGYGIPQDVFVEDFVLGDWISLNNYFERYQIRRHQPNGSLLYILAEQNLTNLIWIELKRVPHMDIQGERYGFPLHAALALKNERAVRALLMPDISLPGSRDHQEAVRCVLENSDDISSQKDQSLLSWAAARGNSGLVTFLLATEKVDIDCQTNYKRTSLSRAAEFGHEAVVKLLLNTGQVEVNSKDTRGQTPLSWAAKGGHKAVVKLLLETGQVEVNLKDTRGQTPLSWAAEGGHEAVVKLLLETSQVEVDSKNISSATPLSLAVLRGHVAVVKLLLETRQVECDFKYKSGHTLLSCAARGGYEAIVKLLLKTGQVEIDSNDTALGQTPLSWAAEFGREAVVKLLLETGKVEVDSNDTMNRTPLSKAAKSGNEAIVKLLLKTGQVNVNSKDILYGRTPLIEAAKSGNEAVVKLLLKTGQAEVNSQCNNGWTALSWASDRRHKAVVKLLVKYITS